MLSVSDGEGGLVGGVSVDVSEGGGAGGGKEDGASEAGE